MIHDSISRSKKIASLSPKSAFLFCLLIPHFNSHGKMNGQPEHIKGQVCPLIKWLLIPDIKKSLNEISQKTNVKWYENEGLMWLQSLTWKEHQPGLRRLGKDEFPDYSETQLPDYSRTTPGLLREYSRTTPGVLPPEVDVDVDVDVKDKPPISPLQGDCADILEFLNQQTGAKFEFIPTNLNLISARLKEGRTAGQLKNMIGSKVSEWKGTDMAKYLRPETLFNKTKCASYCGEMSVPKPKEKLPL